MRDTSKYIIKIILKWILKTGCEGAWVRFMWPEAYPGILFVGGGGVQQNQLGTGKRERGSGGGSHLVRGTGGSCNLVQEISFHIVKFS
jgi:hypothetical protein